MCGFGGGDESRRPLLEYGDGWANAVLNPLKEGFLYGSGLKGDGGERDLKLNFCGETITCVSEKTSWGMSLALALLRERALRVDSVLGTWRY